VLISEQQTRRPLRVSLTPLIDVVFILLLFFMLSSSFVRFQQIEFSSSADDESSVSAAPDESHRVLLHADGEVSVNEQRFNVDDPALSEQLKQWLEKAVTVTVTAEADASVQRLVSLLDHLRQQGITQLDLSESWQP